MSTRARTRAATAAANASSVASPSHAPPTNPTPNSKSSPAKSKRKSNTKDTTTSNSIKQQQEQPQPAAAADPSAEKENIKTASNTTTRSSTTVKKQSQPKSKATPKTNIVHCICSRGDDGSPMIRCAECKVWYHFICVDLSEHEAEEINVYICSSCTQSTGRKTAMVWEGIDALEDCGSEEETVPGAANTITPATKSNTTSTAATAKQRPKKLTVTVSLPPPPPHPQTPSDESDDAGSADDYIAEDEETKGSSKTMGKRRLRRISSPDSGSSSEAEEATATTTRTSRRNRPPTKLRKLSSPRSQTPGSPALASVTTPTTSTFNKSLSRLKRKSSIAEKETSTPAPKRKKSDAGSGGATGDPVRKYCLGKFEDVFKDVFLRYPYVLATTTSAVGESGESGVVKMEEGQTQAPSLEAIVMKKLEELSEEETECLIEDSKRFAAELEQCVFDIYSEGDAAGAKYKDRFRTLQFNLSKPDRSAIHKRIILRTITPKEISLMSSTDLADEETKQHIKIAEKESLEQTILQKPIVPRAKITHKGLQDIEDVHGDLARAREIERQREREQEEEERRERERRERLKAVEKQQQHHQRQRTQSLSVPPESPVVPNHSPITADQQQTWGAPPPVPAHVLQQHHQQSGTAGPTDDILSSSIRPLFAHTMSDVVMAVAPEPELNLADLINIDEDGTEQDTGSASTTSVGTAGGAGVAGDPETSGDANPMAAAMDITSSGVPAPPPLEQLIEPDESVSDKPPGAHHTISGLTHMTASPTSPTTPSSSIVSPFSATRPRGLSFDLNSLWQSAPKDENDILRTPKSPSVSHHQDQDQDQGSSSILLDNGKGTTAGVRGGDSSVSGPSPGTKGLILHGIGGEPGVERVRDLVMEPEAMEVANDDDFDMFLAEEKEDVVDRSGSRGTAAGNSSTPTSTAVPSETTASEAEPRIPQDPEAAFEAIQQCWTGKIHMPLDAAAPQTTTVSAKQVGGRSLEHQSHWWKTLFPSEELRIDGRVNTKSSEDFLTQTRLNQHRELVAVAFSPVSEEMNANFVALIEYLKERDRHGLIFPWGHRPKDTCPGREMYLVPLRAKEPLPEYIELLDELKVPKNRKVDLMIGIWILYRGRLNHPPPQPASTSTGTPSIAVPPTSATLTVPVPPIPNIPPLPPHLASVKSQSPSIPTPSQNPPVPTPASIPSVPPQPTAGLPPQINQAALAAEVASLTPDQVQNLLRTLTASNLPFPIDLPAPGSSGSSTAPQPLIPVQPPHGSHPPPPPPSHPWPGYPVPGGPSSSQPPGGYPPPDPMYGHPPPSSHSHSYPPPPPPHHSSPGHDRRDSYDSPHNYYGGGRGGDRERGERSGWRGGGGGSRNQRGRGKHRGGGGGNAASRPVDSGWPRRPRNDDGNSSPGRRWG